jgi:nucleoside-diphosphate-sugar epimerase
VLTAVTTSAATGRCYNLAGPDHVPYTTFVRDLARAAGLTPPRTISIPTAPLRLVAPLVDGLIGGHRFRRRVRFAERDHTYDIGPARADLGFDPEAWEPGIARRRL